jgi:hypothetical protein|tara:strand:+ start:354 stop:470 length:117 start_codon:yes stop_codon:yes gene_type:complete
MKTFLAIVFIFGSIMLVGAIEDPCTTEGLAPGCMEKNN